MEARFKLVRSGDRTRTSCTNERTCVGAASALTNWASQTDRCCCGYKDYEFYFKLCLLFRHERVKILELLDRVGASLEDQCTPVSRDLCRLTRDLNSPDVDLNQGMRSSRVSEWGTYLYLIIYLLTYLLSWCSCWLNALDVFGSN